MLNINQMPKIVIEEKINLDSTSVWNALNQNNAIETSEARIIINRNLIDDTFDIEIEDIENVNFNSKRNMPFVNIDGKTFLDKNINSWFYINGHLKENKLKSWRVKRNLLENKKFSDIKIASIGLVNPLWNYMNPIDRSFYLNFIKPKFIKNSNIIVSKFDKVIDIKTIEQIILKNRPKYWQIPKFFSKERKKIKPEITFKYNHIYLVPIKPDRFKFNNTFFDVYTKNESGNKIDYDFIFSNKGTLKTSSFHGKSKMTTYFKRNEIYEFENGLTYIGKIKTFDTSYYNYEKKETKLGLSSSSQVGEQIPFNFYNEYFRNFNFGVNSIFQEINILLKTNFKTAILNPDNGEIILDINKYKISNIKEEKPFNMRIIKSKHIADFKNKNFSLVGLERISNKKIF